MICLDKGGGEEKTSPGPAGLIDFVIASVCQWPCDCKALQVVRGAGLELVCVCVCVEWGKFDCQT